MAPPDSFPRAMSTTMVNGIDRLERLFSKKKYAAAAREPAAGRTDSAAYNSTSIRFRKGSAVAAAAQPPSPTRVSLNDMHFPQPSFIRPKAARMVPRDDHATTASGHGPTSLSSRPGTANRSMSVPEPSSTTLSPRPSTATSARSATSAISAASATSPRYVPPPRAGGATRSPHGHGPPVSYATQARATPVVPSPNRRTFDSRRSSGSINYSNYSNYSTSATLSSSGSSTMSASTSTSHGSCSQSHPNRRSSYIETPCELSEAATRAAPHSNNRILAGVNVQRLPKRSSSLLQRRDVFVSPLANLDTYQVQQQQDSRRDSSAITISSGEVSPATIQQNTPLLPSSSLPQDGQSQHGEPKIKIEGDDLHELHELHELQGLADELHTTLKELDQPLFFAQGLPEEKKEDEKKAQEEEAAATATATPVKVMEEPTFTETPVLRRDSVFAPIVLPQDRPTSPSVSTTRRRSRIAARRPMSLRYQRHLPIEPKPSSPSSVLMEPNLGDFLSLSDDDIAEDKVEEKSEEKKEEPTEKETTSTPRASIVADVPPSTPPKTAQQAKSAALGLQKPLPPAPVESSSSSSPLPPPVSPMSVTRRRALLATAAAPASQPPAFQAPPPAFLSLLPGMPLLPSPISLSVSTPPGSANGRPRTPAGEARMAAAFEIARIASQYKFDLAYIATIWPKNMAFLHSGSVSRTDSQMSRMSSSSMGMTMTMGMASSRAKRASHMSHKSHKSHKSQASQASNMAPSTAASTSAHCGVFSPVGLRHSRLEAQFLAAYGLATVRAPYSLSAPTHAKILNAERWLEFSEPEAKADEFSRGYGCAFYRDRAPVTSTSPAVSPPATPLSQQRYQRRPSTDDCDADTEQDGGRTTPRPVRRASRKAPVSSVAAADSSNNNSGNNSDNNRGIVFVAYRRKEVVDERLRRGEKDDLEALYRDVEALVDKILDVHMQQQRQAQLETQRSLPDVEDVLATGFSGAGASCTLRQSRFLGVKAA
ncbi:hypothetical protein SCUCBS95973_006698 [Sporothrix curviconia]|uniref:Proteophosphoglycan ppg4 n=1 Tax=Sporothrix curviconia TaxID=1260050 RepID=A0ABP0C7C8_9PEZI